MPGGEEGRKPSTRREEKEKRSAKALTYNQADPHGAVPQPGAHSRSPTPSASGPGTAPHRSAVPAGLPGPARPLRATLSRSARPNKGPHEDRSARRYLRRRPPPARPLRASRGLRPATAAAWAGRERARESRGRAHAASNRPPPPRPRAAGSLLPSAAFGADCGPPGRLSSSPFTMAVLCSSAPGGCGCSSSSSCRASSRPSGSAKRVQSPRAPR